MLIVPEMPGHKSRAERKDKNYESKEKYYFDGSIIAVWGSGYERQTFSEGGR